MIFRLEYKNKALKTARVDIVTPTGTGVEAVEGTGYPFMLKYEGDKKDKSLTFLSSSAEINIYETPLFNIDTLKTSGETDIRVNYYIDSVLEWTGFVIPDFFSREIGGDGVVSMVASDRLSVLDSEVLEGLPVTVTLRTLLSSSLAKTGLTLPLKTVVDFATVSGSTNHILNHSIRSQRFTDTKGRSVNCKDIIKSILVATNSKLMQRKGEWWVVNKMQHELGGGRVYTSPTAFTDYVEDLISFTDVTRGAMRTIAPVAGGVGVFQEYGGGALAPDNYAFESGLSGWTLHSGFTASIDDRRVLGYTQSGNVYTPIYDAPGTARPYLLNRNLRPADNQINLTNIYTIPHAKTSIPVVSSSPFSAKIKVEVNATGRGGGSAARFVVMLKRPGRDSLILNRDGQWLSGMGYKALLFATFTGEDLEAVDGNGTYSGTIAAAGDEGYEDDINDYSIDLLIFGSGRSLSDGTTVVRDETVLINSASVQFTATSNDTPKGTLYKADQGGESYTKIHDTETTVFGDYLTGGLNGYFYNYAPDDTSSLLAPNGSRSQPAWVNTYTQNTEPLPLLQQTIRQMRRMFSVAHDSIKGEIDVADFDPLSIFEDCERRFVIVEAEFDFLRGSLQVVLEEVAYQNLTVREYIYSYFGEGDEGIRGISGISAGSSGGGGGGGMAPEPSWLENEITIDSESGLLSVDGWHVKGDLIIEGQVNQWLAQQLVVDDARIQVNRKQGGATVDSGLVIYDKDTSAEVSSLVYDVNGIWRAGGQRVYTDAYKPLADNATNLGGYSAASYPRKDENAVITGAWTINNDFRLGAGTTRNLYTGSMRIRDTGTGAWIISPESGAPARWYFRPDGNTEVTNTFFISQEGVGFGTENPQERLHVAGNGLFSGAVTASTYKNIGNSPRKIIQWERTDGSLRVAMETAGFNDINFSVNEVSRITLSTSTGSITAQGAVTAGGNVGTSNFASQALGWRITPAGQADFRHIYTDELQAKAFTADISQALVGSDVLTKSVAKLAQDWTSTANGATSNLYVEELEGFAGYQVFAVGDRLLMRVFDRSGGGLLIKNIWATVASYVSTTDNVQRYTITVNSGGMTGQTVYRGSMILDYGTSGSGVIERTVLDQQGSPYSRVTTWENNPWTPENFTLHYQSGNLNGIANAEGWGVYSQNSFLTGKLLVGDLTKAGQYMEYENGQLNIKGQITVTGGNAATKEDVDAVQVGGRNLLLNSGGAPDFLTTSTRKRYEVNASELARSAGGEVTITFEAKCDDSTAIQYYLYAHQSDTYLSAEFTSAASPVWAPYSITFILPPTIPLGDDISFSLRKVVNTTGFDMRRAKLEKGNRATDWTPAPEDVDAGIVAAESAAKTFATSEATAAESAAKTFATSQAAAALTAAEGYTDDLTSRVETTLGLADLENINETLITGNKVRTSLLEVTDIVAQGITAGHVEGLTLDFDKGTIGAWTIDNNALLSASELIELNAVENKIAVRHAEGSGYGVELGDFGLADITQIGENLTLPITTYNATPGNTPQAGHFTVIGGSGGYTSVSGRSSVVLANTLLTRYLNSGGSFQNTAVNLSNSFSPGALYSLRLSFYVQVWGMTGVGTMAGTQMYYHGAIPAATSGLAQALYDFLAMRNSGSQIDNLTVTVRLRDGAGNVVEEQEYDFGAQYDAGLYGDIFQRIAFEKSFVAPTSAMRVEVSVNMSGASFIIAGEDLDNPGTYTLGQGTGRIDVGGATIDGITILRPNKTELSSQGFQVVNSSKSYFRVQEKFGQNFVEARGVQEFISPNGTYRLKVSDSGIERSTDGGNNWITIT